MQPNEQGQMKTACNALSLMECGMTEAAALRMAKQWEDKCAEVVKLRLALAPFAKAADLFASGYGDLTPLGTDAITVGDLRNAAAAMTQDQR